MAESKILEEDRDEWFYNSMKRYTNLYMYDFEFPVDAMDIVNDLSICVSGMQNYSKKCELLQLSVPIKLLPKHIEDGLCKDRDFKIISGGYATNRITQIKPLKAFPNFLATIQNGQGGFTVFKLGDDEHGVIKQEAVLSSVDLAQTTSSTMATLNNQVIVNSTTESTDGENVLYEWKLDQNSVSSSDPLKYILPSKVTDIGSISKLKYWDPNVIAFSSTNGFVSMFDLRANKSTLTFSTTPTLSGGTSNIYSFDSIPLLNRIGCVDSGGGYFTVDPRNVKENSAESRLPLPGLTEVPAVLGEKFNIEYEPKPSIDESSTRFVVTGMKQDVVSVFMETPKTEEIVSVFTHDGHSKTVTHVCWHTITENLLFSTSVDSVLHAWQYADKN